MKSNRARGLASTTTFLVTFISFGISSIALGSGPGWYNNFEQAVQVARQQGRPIFVDFSTSWCSVCKQMDRTTLADPNIISRLDNFVKVKVDGDARRDLCSAYGVEAYPTFIHLDSAGRILEKREGSMRSREMATALDRTWQSVSASQQAVAANQAVASAEANLLQVKPEESSTQERPATTERSASRERSESSDRQVAQADSPSATDSSQGQNLYNVTDPKLQGSVYAMGSNPTSQRRSRFGGGAGDNSGLRQLAEATAQPDQIDTSAETKASAESKPSDEKTVDSTKSVEIAKAEEPAEVKNSATSETKDSEAKSEKTAEFAKIDEADEKAIAKTPVAVASAKLPSPIIESRLSGLNEQAMPKPLLSRTASPSTEELTAPTKTVASNNVKPSGDPLATIRRIQKDDTGAAQPAVSNKTQEISAEKTSEEPKAESAAVAKAEEKKPESKVAEKKSEPDASEKKTETKTVAKEETKKSETSADSKSSEKSESKKSDSEKTVAKTSEGATRSDIDRWMKDADNKLIGKRKKEARAMYNKVVDKDPKNKFGKSDMAYVKMVSLIVDKDSDLLRRQAYNKIKEFETRFPDSEHMDYYTLIRAILAADLGELTEAHKLLGSYSDNFPDSKYQKMAKDTWKSLPSAKSSSKSKSSADSGRKKGSSNT